MTEQRIVEASYRSQLSAGEDVVDPSTWAGSVPVAHGIAPRVRVGHVTRTKLGRRNHYTINPGGHLRQPMLRDLAVGPLLDVLITDGQPPPRPTIGPRRRR